MSGYIVKFEGCSPRVTLVYLRRTLREEASGNYIASQDATPKEHFQSADYGALEMDACFLRLAASFIVAIAGPGFEAPPFSLGDEPYQPF